MAACQDVWVVRNDAIAAAAVAEWIQVPTGVAERIATRLLTFLKQRDGRDPSEVLCKRVMGAMGMLRDSVAREEVEAVLRAAVLSEEMEQRLRSLSFVKVGGITLI